MKNSIITVLLLIATGLAITTGFTKKEKNLQLTNIQINIKDIPEHGLSIIGPADPSFNKIVMSLTQGKQNAVIGALRPYSVFIKNTGSKTVVAYTLKWEILKADGTAKVQTRDYITLWKLMGITSSDKDGYMLEPNSAIFVSPANIEPLKASKTRDLNEDSLTPDMTAYLDKLSMELAQCINITVELDGVFFEDGTFVGQDSTEFFAKVEAKRNAKRDLILEIKQELRRGKTKQEALIHVDELANSPELRLNSKSTPTDYYNKNKRDVAATLFQLRKSVNDDKAIELILQQMREPLPELRKF